MKTLNDINSETIIEILGNEMPICKGYFISKYSNSVQINYWNSEPSVYTINFSWDKIFSLMRKRKINKIKKTINVRHK